jgi:hypothetical protein
MKREIVLVVHGTSENHPAVMTRVVPLVIFFGMIVAGGAMAQSDDPLPALIEQTQKELDAAPATDNPRQAQLRQQLAQILKQFTAASNVEEAMQLENLVLQFGAASDPETLRASITKLGAGLRARREERDKKKAAEVDAVLKSSAAAVRAATKPEDLDDVIASLAKLKGRGDGDYSPAVAATRNQIEAAVRFVVSWQDYLAARAAGNVSAAKSCLQNLANPDYGFVIDWIPRSEILKRMNESSPASPARRAPEDAAKAQAAKFVEIMDRVKTPADLSPAMTELRTLYRNGNSYPFIEGSRLVDAVGDLEQSYRDLQAGLPTQITLLVPDLRGESIRNPVPQIRAQLLLLALPRYLGLPEEAKALAGENPSAFLKRIETEAGAKGDYRLAARAADTEVLLRQPDSNRGVNNDSQASLFVAGQNQEEAGQIELAVVSYLKALAIPLQIVPPKVIGERLTALKTKIPERYTEGMSLYLTPPNPMRDQMMMQQRMMMGGGNVRPPNPTLAVPAAPARPVAPPRAAPTATPKKP